MYGLIDVAKRKTIPLQALTDPKGFGTQNAAFRRG
jgi:hypothetical protein